MQWTPVLWRWHKRHEEKKLRARRRKRVWVGVVLGLVVIGYLGTLFVQGYIGYLKKDLPSVAALTTAVLPQETVFLDRHGALLYRLLPGQRRAVVALKDVSPNVVHALMAVEDRRFYEHSGVDPFGIARAILADVRLGEAAQGASTITQQLARLLFLTPSQTLTRKVKEAILAAELEKNLTKDQILELYVNAVPFGSDIYGVEAASREFFGQRALDLNVAQAATLAAVAKAPTRYFPFGGDAAGLTSRKNLVIGAMRDTGFITPLEAIEARAEPLVFSASRTTLNAPHFVYTALDDLRLAYGGETIQQGLIVTTTLDAALQRDAETAVKQFIADRGPAIGADNAAAVVLEAKTGNVLSLVGSVDYANPTYGAFNAARAQRQPGSTLKPFVYALAFEDGLASPFSSVVDEPVHFGAYTPENFDNRFHGTMSVHTALIYSYNIPALKMLNRVGVTRLAERLQRCNLTIDPKAGLTAAVGGSATSLFDLTGAYTMFANAGVCVPGRTLLKVINAQGGALLDRTAVPPKFGTGVFTASAMAGVNRILTDTKYTYSEYRDIAANSAFKDVAIKTGTSDGPRDAWVVGYSMSANLVVGVWVGNHDNSQMRDDVLALSVATPLWRKIFKQAYERFKSPQ